MSELALSFFSESHRWQTFCTLSKNINTFAFSNSRKVIVTSVLHFQEKEVLCNLNLPHTLANILYANLYFSKNRPNKAFAELQLQHVLFHSSWTKNTNVLPSTLRHFCSHQQKLLKIKTTMLYSMCTVRSVLQRERVLNILCGAEKFQNHHRLCGTDCQCYLSHVAQWNNNYATSPQYKL